MPVRTAVCPKPRWFYVVLKGLGLLPGQLLGRGRLEGSSNAGGRLVAFYILGLWLSDTSELSPDKAAVPRRPARCGNWITVLTAIFLRRKKGFSVTQGSFKLCAAGLS